MTFFATEAQRSTEGHRDGQLGLRLCGPPWNSVSLWQKALIYA